MIVAAHACFGQVAYDGGIIDITDSRSIEAWPIAGYSFLILRRFAWRETCSIKTEMVRMMTWFYTSDAAERICERRHFVRLPDFIQ